MNEHTQSAAIRAFIVWEPSNSRSATLADEFSAECVFVHYLGLKRPILAPFKYAMQAVKTWLLLFRLRPTLVFVQNPPTFAPLAVWMYCAVTGAEFVIDSHTGVFLENKWKWLAFLHRFLARRARVNIVTNRFLSDIVQSWGGRSFIFSDVPVEFSGATPIVDRPKNFIVVVNSFSYDEPLTQVLEAAGHLPDVSFAVTGDVRRCPDDVLHEAPENVRFVGFVRREEYVNMLYSADAAVVLTTEDHTMQRGAYESMSLGVPIITSDWPLLRETFFKGACYVDNSVSSIVDAIRKVIGDKDAYKRGIIDLKRERRAIWERKLNEFSRSYLSAEPVSK